MSLKIGYHASISLGLSKAAHEAFSIGASSFQFFSRNPRGGASKAESDEETEKAISQIKKYSLAPLLCHAPYTLNACSAKKEVREFARLCILEDLAKLEKLQGRSNFVMHPGSYTVLEKNEAINYTSQLLTLALKKSGKAKILLETMGGQGSEIGSNFQELKTIIGEVGSDRLGVCIDTCHLFASGYDIKNNLIGVLEEFDKQIGLDKIFAVHLNDSKFPLGSKKDRHEKIGDGEIGLEAIIKIINHPRLKELPFYLETPQDLNGYKEEIKLLKANFST